MSSKEDSNSNKKLFEEYRRTKDVTLRNDLVERYLYVVDILVRKYVNKGVEYEDLYQVGSMALVFAVERFDPDRGFEFTSFATPTITGEIKRYFRDKSWAVKVPRRLKEIATLIPSAKEHLRGTLQRNPKVSDIAEYLGYTEEEILEAMEGGHAYGAYSLQQTFEESGENGDESMLDRITGREDTGFGSLENADFIQNTMQHLTEEEKEIFKMRFVADKTQQEIASKLGVSQMTISRAEKRIKEKFRQEYYR